MRKLYHSYLSPYARRVLIVLLEKGLEPPAGEAHVRQGVLGTGVDQSLPSPARLRRWGNPSLGIEPDHRVSSEDLSGHCARFSEAAAGLCHDAPRSSF